MNNEILNIMIVDDNPAIHQDFIKVLTFTDEESTIDEMDEILFSDDAELSDLHTHTKTQNLPTFSFDTANQGNEAVEKVQSALQQGKYYALAFIDMRMPPGWDGIETIKRMWAIDKDIQIVICTAYSDYSWEKTIQNLGVEDNYLILKKPFDTIVVRQLACSLTKKWCLLKSVRANTALLNNRVEEKTQKLQHSLSLVKSTIESSIDGILVLDLDDKIIDFNSNFIQLWNINKKENIKGNILDSLWSQMKKNLTTSDDSTIDLIKNNGRRADHWKHTVKFIDGKVIECCTSPHIMNEIIIGQICTYKDITQQSYLEEKLKFQAMHDSLTSLPNRFLLADRIQQSIEFSSRKGKLFALLFIDLDRFKVVNDSLGHTIGDELLIKVAKRMSTLIRKSDTLARIGGDEFVLLINSIDDPKKGTIPIINKLTAAMEKPFNVKNQEMKVSCSIGISIYPDDASCVDELLKYADLAMYQSKAIGGKQFSFYTKNLNVEIKKLFTIENDLYRAIEKKEFTLLYQPQFDIHCNNLFSVEALIRWNHPEKGLLMPDDFIPIAEDSGLIIPLGEWVLRESCRQLSKWKKDGMLPIRVAVNVSTKQLQQSNFDIVIRNILKEFDIDPKYLELEITENVIITDETIVPIINKLKKIGINIVLDDFGTGNSSISYLKKIKIDRLKISHAFISNISKSECDEVIIQAIISMAKSFNFKVLAEGIEHEHQMQFLEKLQCNEMQGFLLSKPLSAKQFESLMSKHTLQSW